MRDMAAGDDDNYGLGDSNAFGDLNRQFYSADPAGYFRTRLHLLMLAAGRSAELAALFDEGVAHDGVRFTRDDAGAEESPRISEFVAAEATVLMHHASEALVRLFLAHAAQPSCPWLFAVDNRRRRIHQADVDALAASVWTPERRAAVGHVFLGQANPKGERAEAAQAAERLLRILAHRLNDESTMYNATKHGMTVRSGESYVRAMADDDPEHSIGGSGPSVAFLDYSNDGDTQTWRETTAWVQIGQMLLFTDLAIRQMEALWTIAKARYLGENIAGVHLVTDEAIDEALNHRSTTGGITRFSRVVATRLIEHPTRPKGSSPPRQRRQGRKPGKTG